MLLTNVLIISITINVPLKLDYIQTMLTCETPQQRTDLCLTLSTFHQHLFIFLFIKNVTWQILQLITTKTKKKKNALKFQCTKLKVTVKLN